MLFNSLSFLIAFGILSVVYYSLPHHRRWPLLLVASLAFYATFDLLLLVPLVAVILLAYVGGLAIDAASTPRSRRALTAGFVAAVLTPLFVYRYVGFAVGLSFYTFSAVSYLVDVHRRRLAPETHLGWTALYLAFFPKLLAGPIERAGPFLAQLRTRVVFDEARVVAGLQQMLWGFFKKVVIADRLAMFVDRAYAQPAFTAPADLVIATHLFAIQLYCDFSGYSDIAIGASRVLGIDLTENFRRPYLSTSVAEFWSKRWHLSLASWFRDYVYIPLGGNRVSFPRQALNVMAVFLLSGLWHGANWTFVVWGGLNGLYQVASLAWRHVATGIGFAALPTGIATPFRRLVTFYLILISWVFFRAASVPDALTIFTRTTSALPALPGLLWARLSTGEHLSSLILVGVLVVVEVFDEHRSLWDRLNGTSMQLRWLAYYALVLSLVVLGVWHVQQFVYMQF